MTPEARIAELEAVVGQQREEIARRRAQGARVVFTNGVFDLLHLGHVRYLREARDLGDLLIVAVNSDASTRRLKGPQRPIIGESERAETLAALIAVDYVSIFADTTAERLEGFGALLILTTRRTNCGTTVS